MKKKNALLVILSIQLISWRTFAEGEMSGIFMVVKGQVLVKVHGQGAGVQAKIGAKIHEGDAVVTGPDSRAKIVMTDHNVFNVSPDTTFQIEKYKNDASEKNVSIKLDGGKLRSSLEQKYDGDQSQFNVRTPTAVAGVRGTDFVSSFNAKSKESNFVTFHGTVAVAVLSANGKLSNRVLVQAGQQTSVKSSQRNPEKPVKIPQSQLQQFNHETSGGEGGNLGSSSSRGGGGYSQANAAGSASLANSGSRDPASTTPTLGQTTSVMVDSQDMSPDAAKGLASTPPPAAPGLGAVPPSALPPPVTNSGFLQNLSGAVGGTAHVQVTLTPH